MGDVIFLTQKYIYLISILGHRTLIDEILITEKHGSGYAILTNPMAEKISVK